MGNVASIGSLGMTAVMSSKSLGDLFRVGLSRHVLQSQSQSEGVPFYRGREITLLAAEGFVNNALFISEDLYADLAAKNGVPSAGRSHYLTSNMSLHKRCESCPSKPNASNPSTNANLPRWTR
jgi:hypothetical protein